VSVRLLRVAVVVASYGLLLTVMLGLTGAGATFTVAEPLLPSKLAEFVSTQVIVRVPALPGVNDKVAVEVVPPFGVRGAVPRSAPLAEKDTVPVGGTVLVTVAVMVVCWR
jgi:hypothetical protein